MRTTILLGLLLISSILFSQSTKTIETYYDVYAQTKLKERYSVEEQRMQKHGKYQMWDKFGSIMEETYYSNGLKNGSSKQFFTEAMIRMFESDPKNIGKIAREENYKGDKLHGICKYYKILDNDEIVLEATREYSEGLMLKEIVLYDNGAKKQIIQYNGLCEQWFENGQKEAEYTQVNGIENGKATVWYPNGKIAEEPVYKMGKLLSEKNYYQNGNLLSELVYDEETSNLVGMKEYAMNQNLSAKIEKTGKFTIKGTIYDTATQQINSVENMIYMDFGSGEWINFGDGKQQYKGVQAVNHGYAEYFFKGKLVTSGEYNEGYRIGKWKIYYNKDFIETKNLDSVTYYRELTFGEKGIPQGMVTDYFANGSKQWEGQLVEVNPDVFDGECKFYYESGQLLSRQFFNRGLKTGTWNSYYQNGNLTEKVTFINDKPDGEYIQFWENGNKKQEGVYKNGLFQREWKSYDQDGNLLGITTYDNNGHEIESKSDQQLDSQKENEIRNVISDQRTKIRQSFILNSPSPQQKIIGDSYEVVFNSEFTKINQLSNHTEKMKHFNKLEKLGKKILSLDEKGTNDFSKSLKGQNSSESIYEIFGID